MYVIVLFKTMWRRLMEIMLMAKLMEIVSFDVIYMFVCIYIIFIYLFTLCQQLIVRVLCGFCKKLRVDFFFLKFLADYCCNLEIF